MNKSAWLLLTSALATGLLGANMLSHGLVTVSFIASGIFATAWILAVIIGRRFKFDPVLR
ncbi:hypothetical protein OOJ96_21150 [Pseudomonas sp. 15FMM2]|uniref:Uncharacterized protein n=1 Tax=Pseudomonas imrae TaxID=2992837 RepID=A0ACC7PKU5_9PSED